ncbi:F0F1 ATP synthase subunit delta [Piscinibacter koreensis]|uniref:ATP synthase subunit delta n=1 Tax=Piscinibacter koreensis TaxID=2742824 RepID=A0A7Y6NJ77_9BURK|nr:F0F1 ATP synthase subunit delta [Schlegelella koreensis]NUZ04167.1 F0F1 ATP synthase subunit delta [Schlegelella koreensis]
MAELATIARPYAEALMKASANGDGRALAREINALARIAGTPEMRQFADNPKVSVDQVVEVLTSVVNASSDGALSPAAGNLLRMVVENGRLPALGEIARQFEALVQDRSGTARAVVESAFPLDDAQLADVVQTMERRFGRRLDATVEVRPELIGGVRIVVGDEVLDTSIQARLAQMKAALTA